MQALLSFEQSPPFSAPLRFFLTAPLFGALAGLLLCLEGGDLLQSRWMPSALACLHLLTLGFMMQVMLGALIQILPVVAGANLRNPRRTALQVHLLLSVGTVLLAAGFWQGLPVWLEAGAGLVALAVCRFLIDAGRAVFFVPSSSPTIRGIKLALLGLTGVVSLGLLLVYLLGHGSTLSLSAVTDLHALWGFSAWAGVLLLALAYVVVPMFQLTPAYRSRAAWWAPWLIVLLVGLASVAVFLPLPALLVLAKSGLAVIALSFALTTLRLQAKRRRAKHDAHSRYWQLSMAATVLAAFLMLTATVWGPSDTQGRGDLLLMVLLLQGGFVACMSGMLYKIVPFLAWLHLQNALSGQGQAPNVNRLLPEAGAMRQFRLFCLALLLTLLAVFVPDTWARVAGLAWLASMSWLGYNLYQVLRAYREVVRNMPPRVVA